MDQPPPAPPASTPRRWRRRILAFNTATASTNRIHDDGVARAYGFRGGLVPGVDVFAYLTGGPVATWGPAWLGRGTISARFAAPVYDGEAVDVDAVPSGGGLDLAVAGPDGTVRATGRATPAAPGAGGPPPPAAPLPVDRPAASPGALRPATVLGSLHEVFSAEQAAAYLDDVRETNPVYADQGVAHPGWLLRRANTVLSRNVVLGPWIHVSSDVTLLGVVADGDPVDTTAAVLDEFERRGHRFVTLDVAVASAGRPVQRIIHTAIHTPRRA